MNKFNFVLKNYVLIKRLLLFFMIVMLIIAISTKVYWLLVFCVIALAFYILYMFCLRCARKLVENGNRIQFVEGAPRVGKTDWQKTIAVLLACKQWSSVKRQVSKRNWKKYNRISDDIMRTQYVNENQIDFLYTFHEAQKCYAFYKEHTEYIPCLISNVTVLYNDKKSLPLKFEHITGAEAVGYKCVFLVTEASAMFPIDSYMYRAESDKLLMIANFGERIGHYLDGYLIMDTQDALNVSKDIKRLCPSIMKIDHSLSKILKIFGMRGYKAKNNERVEEGETIIREDAKDGYKLFILPTCIGQYNQRHLRSLYPSKDEIIKAYPTEGLIIADNEPNRRLYSKRLIEKKDKK